MGLKAAEPMLDATVVDVDVQYLVFNLLTVVCVLAVSLVVAALGVGESLRFVFVLAAGVAGCAVWLTPGHGAILDYPVQRTWQACAGMGLYLGYLAATVTCLLRLGRRHYRAQLPLAKQLQVRLLQALAVGALAYVGAKALLFAGIQAEWPGFSAEASWRILPFVLLGLTVLLWLALAPPDAWLRLALRIEVAEAHAFATTFALQTKDDLVAGRDLSRRSSRILLCEEVARALGFGFDELARLRLAAVLLDTGFDLRASDACRVRSRTDPRPSADAAASQGVHPVLSRTVWVPDDVLRILEESVVALPQDRGARILKTVDRFLVMADPWDPGDGLDGIAAQAASELDQQFPGWKEVCALRRVLEHRA
ncbi:MAG: hypothetical protein OXG43_11870 [Chloroflexi bacterium]|nr:hypothetical protein [Chloroflexota bacterium]